MSFSQITSIVLLRQPVLSLSQNNDRDTTCTLCLKKQATTCDIFK